METEALYDRSPSIGDVEDWLALGAGTFLLVAGVFRRSAIGACLAVSSTPLLYRGITGRWPEVLNGPTGANGTRAALAGERGVTPAGVLAEQHRRMAEPGSAQKAKS